MKNRKLWLIPLCILLTAVILAVIFWQTLIVYLAPKMVLAGALKDRIIALEARIAAGPIPVLARGIDPEGRNQLDLQLDTINELVGPVQYDMRVQMQQHPRRLLAEGKASFKSTEMDISLYLDSSFAAVRSREILGGKFYGLTYDSFSQDIRSNKLAAMLIGEKVLNDWETNVQTLQNVMQKEIPVLPDLSRIDPESLIMGILAMDADVEQVRIDLNDGEVVYHVVSFDTTGAEIASGLSYLNLELPNMPSADEELEFSFWLKDRQLCKLELEAESCKLDIYWGNPAVSFLMEGDIYIEYYDGSAFKTCKVHTEQRDGLYRESITFSGEETLQLSYDWVASTGSLVLSVDRKGERTEIPLTLKPFENGFSVETKDFGALMYLLADTPDRADNPCTMTVIKGTDFQAPEYTDFVLWSMEELMAIVFEFGKLFGLEQ